MISFGAAITKLEKHHRYDPMAVCKEGKLNPSEYRKAKLNCIDNTEHRLDICNALIKVYKLRKDDAEFLTLLAVTPIQPLSKHPDDLWINTWIGLRRLNKIAGTDVPSFCRKEVMAILETADLSGVMKDCCLE
jgi:hypothetical protein